MSPYTGREKKTRGTLSLKENEPKSYLKLRIAECLRMFQFSSRAQPYCMA